MKPDTNTMSTDHNSDVLKIFGIDSNIIEHYDIFHRKDGVHIILKLINREQRCPVCQTRTTKVVNYIDKKIKHSVVSTSSCFIDYQVCAKLIEISRKDRRTNDRHCVLYSPLFFRKITPSVLPEHLFWGRNAGRAWLLLVYMKTRKKSNPEPCFSRKSLKPAPGSIQNPFQNQKRPDRPARFRGTVWPRIQLTGFMLAGSSTGTG